MIEQVQSFLAAKVGAVVAAPVDPLSLRRSLQQIIWAGAYVGTVVPPPATSLLNAPQYLTGKVLGDAAAAYIKDRLGGKANVVLLTHDSLQFLAPRFVAMRDSLKDMPGATIVADISPPPVNKEGGFATMRTILLAHPDIDVVLGADTVVLGALAALRAAGKARPDQFLGGIDGEPEAVAEIKKAADPTRRASAWPHRSSAMPWGSMRPTGSRARASRRRWTSCPARSPSTTSPQYEADLADPAAVYADPARRDRVSQDVRQHLLRHARPVCELSVVVGDGSDARRLMSRPRAQSLRSTLSRTR